MAAFRGRTRALVLDSHPHLHSHSRFCSHFCSRFYRPRSRFCSHYRPRSHSHSHSHSPSHPSRRCSFFRREIVHPLPQCARPRRPRSLVAIAIAASSPPALPFPRQCSIPAPVFDSSASVRFLRLEVRSPRRGGEASAFRTGLGTGLDRGCWVLGLDRGFGHGFGSRVMGARCSVR